MNSSSSFCCPGLSGNLFRSTFPDLLHQRSFAPRNNEYGSSRKHSSTGACGSERESKWENKLERCYL